MNDQITVQEETTAAKAGLSTADIAAGRMRATPSEGSNPLFARNEAEDFRTHWRNVQTGFVDEPRKAVKDADELVASAIKRLAEIFAAERDKLEHEWDRNDSASTEDLRLAMQRYHAFFDRLLSV